MESNLRGKTIKSGTFHTSMDTRVLVVVPSYGVDVPNPPEGMDYYESDAAQILEFLESVFCTKTISALKKQLETRLK
jgi:hypothetical protein